MKQPERKLLQTWRDSNDENSGVGPNIADVGWGPCRKYPVTQELDRKLID